MKWPFAARSGPTSFRLRWWGYDRTEVDQFLDQTAADRQRLQEGLAHLDVYFASYREDGPNPTIAAARREAREIRAKAEEEAQELLRKAVAQAEFLQREHHQITRQQLEHLTALRSQVDTCFDASIAAVREAPSRLPARTEAEACDVPATKQASIAAMAGWAFKLFRLVRLPRSRVYRLLASASVCAVIGVAAYQFVVPDASPGRAGANGQQAAQAASDPQVADSNEPPVAPAEQSVEAAVAKPSSAEQITGLVLTLTAWRTCWIGTTIDGGQRLERLLKADETIILHAHDEAVLRVGDAAALRMLINHQPTKPLGAAGEVVTRRITRANYSNFLIQDPDQSLVLTNASESQSARLEPANLNSPVDR